MTPRTVINPTEPANRELASSATRAVKTDAPESFRQVTTSRRNAALRSLDSTMVNSASGRRIFSGIAGEPPPEPKVDPDSGTLSNLSCRNEGLDNQAVNRGLRIARER